MDIVCFSHLRWNFVYQRPQHLLSRFAQTNRVFYIEEAEFISDFDRDYYFSTEKEVTIVIPKLGGKAPRADIINRQKRLISKLLIENKISDYLLWYYTPMALPISDHLQPQLTVYDCMDELSAFKAAPPILKTLERRLLKRADIVFTGGYSLYQAKKELHTNIHPFPSSIDKSHFSKARKHRPDPPDQAEIPYPRFGFYGVIDERFDIELVDQVARRRPDWQFILIGPVAKIDPDILPQRRNIHYLGQKSYNELPDYLQGWDIAIIPFMLNKSTRFISPTKTPEYLAGGKPVISTPIRDVINPYGIRGLVHIVSDARQFIQKAEQELDKTDKRRWLARVDAFLEPDSWGATWEQMKELIIQQLEEKRFYSERKRRYV